jgi:uncharacterized protein DUF4167
LINNRQNGRRRGRGGERVPNAPNRGPNPNQRPDSRARGNAAQLHEKYKALARDLQMQGDRVTAEYYLQFADHYFRVLSENRQRFEEQRPRREWQPNEGFEAAEGNDEGYEGDEGERDAQLDQRGQGEPRGDEQRYAGQPTGEARFDDRDNGPRDNGPRDSGHRGNGEREHGQRNNGPRDNGMDRSARRPDRQDRDDRADRDDHDREEVSERIEVDRLPPSIPFDPAPLSDQPGETDEAILAEAPRRRGRPRRPRPDDLPVVDV